MTLNGLDIDEVTINKFKTTCAAHFAKGGPPVCHKARMGFFSDLKRQYGMEHIISHLPELYEQLAKWEAEVRANDKAVA